MKSPIRPKKHLGQHFLTDPNTARRIISALRAPSDAYVVEIGPGTGALTVFLQERYSQFEAIELDPQAVAYLRTSYPELRVREENVLSIDWEHVGTPPLYIIGNLPYNITSPVLFGLLAAHDVIAEAVLHGTKGGG